MQSITKVFSDIVKPYIDAAKQTLTQQINVSDAKNLCPTMNPFDPSTLESWSDYFTINADGSITANGTPPNRTSIASRVVLPAGQYIMNGCPSGGNWNAYRIMFLKYTPSETVVYADTGSIPTTITLDEETEIVIRVDLYSNYTASNLVYKPMICLKSVYDLDPSYAPPAKTNQQLTKATTALIDNQNVNGAVNLLPNNLTSQVLYGITLTVNSDGTFTANGTTSAMINHTIATIKGLSGKYRLTGCPSGGSGETYQLQIQEGSTYVTPGDYGSGFDYLFDSSKTYNIRLVVRSNQTLNNLTFKPMISVASLNLFYIDYVPYAKSNKELTEDVENLETALNNQLADFSFTRLSMGSNTTGQEITFKQNSPFGVIIMDLRFGNYFVVNYWDDVIQEIAIKDATKLPTLNKSTNSASFTLTNSTLFTLNLLMLGALQ